VKQKKVDQYTGKTNKFILDEEINLIKYNAEEWEFELKRMKSDEKESTRNIYEEN
jgi:hypothetical protein